MKIFTSLLLSLFFLTSLNAQISDVAINLNHPVDLVQHGDFLYFSEYLGGRISRIDINAAIPAVVDTVLTTENPAALYIHNDDLYFTSFLSGSVSKIDLSQPLTNPVELVTGLTNPNGLFIKDNSLYISEASDVGQISKIDITATTPEVTVVATGFDFPSGLLFIDDELYIVNNGSGLINKINITDENPIPIDVVTGLNRPSHGIILLDNYLYFSQHNEDVVSRINLMETTPVVENVILDVNGPSGMKLIGDEIYIVLSSGKIVKTGINTVGLEELNWISNIHIYPNPVENFIQFSGLEKANQIQIVNVKGQVVKQMLVQPSQKIALTDWASGSYFVRFENGQVLPFVKN